ncbi:DNA methylase [bacterium]|nr:MAG: DNA methylase [bacterium]
MALSPTHAFGQIIGNVIEAAVYEPLKAVADEFGLYLDQKRPRKARNNKAKVSWIDGRGNSHDLDYVMEEGGTEEVIGNPRAFIEIAWRRYTKHSKNKAQEIEGAVGHLRSRYHEYSPLLGAVLSGEFTAPSLAQLRSHGFTLLYFPYKSVIAAFSSVGIDASFDEKSADQDVLTKVEQYKALSSEQHATLIETLRETHRDDISNFVASLRVVLGRQVEFVLVAPLHGSSIEMTSVEEAISFIEGYDESQPSGKFVKYVLVVRYNNGAKVDGEFPSKAEAVEFLRRMM